MTSYLQGGWYGNSPKAELRTAVIDGAVDAAGMLLRAGVPAAQITAVALKVRTLGMVADPQLRGAVGLSETQRERIAVQLEPYLDDHPALYGLVSDCLKHVRSVRDLTAFYLHLIHIQRMVQLLSHAMGLGAAVARAEARRPNAKSTGARRASKKSAPRANKPKKTRKSALAQRRRSQTKKK